MVIGSKSIEKPHAEVFSDNGDHVKGPTRVHTRRSQRAQCKQGAARCSPGEVTLLLSSLQTEETANRLFSLIYPELLQMAAGKFRRERRDHTLQPTALVHEAFIRLFEHGPKKYANRAHFFGVVSRAMRQILVDQARRRRAEKRAGAWRHVPLEEADLVSKDSPDLLGLEEALIRLEALDAPLCQLAELRLFGGLSTSEIAVFLQRGKSTVRRDWRITRAWLQRELGSAAQ